MDPDRTEKPGSKGGPPLGAAARKRAFLLAAGAIVLAAGALLALGSPGHGDAPATGETGPRRRVFDPDPDPQPVPSAERAPDAAELREVRAVAARFARAFLARESGRFDAAVRRQLRLTASAEAWRSLRRAVRVTPAWRPPVSRFDELSGLTETSQPGVVEATVAFDRGRQRRYLGLLLAREGGRWHASPKEL